MVDKAENISWHLFDLHRMWNSYLILAINWSSLVAYLLQNLVEKTSNFSWFICSGSKYDVNLTVPPDLKLNKRGTDATAST